MYFYLKSHSFDKEELHLQIPISLIHLGSVAVGISIHHIIFPVTLPYRNKNNLHKHAKKASVNVIFRLPTRVKSTKTKGEKVQENVKLRLLSNYGSSAIASCITNMLVRMQ